MLNKEDYVQIDNLIMSAEAVCNAVSDYSSDLKRAYRSFFRSPEAVGYEEDYSVERENGLPNAVKKQMGKIIKNLNHLKAFDLESPCVLTKRLEDMIHDYMSTVEMLFNNHDEAASWYDIYDYDDWINEFRAILLLTQFANIDKNIVLIGSNGSGKSTLAQILKGNDSERITVIPAQKSMFFLLENEILATSVSDVKEKMLNNNIENSKSDSDYEFNDFQKHQFTRLVIAMREEHHTYLRKCADDGVVADRNHSIYDRVRKIIRTIFKDIDICLGESFDELIYCKRDENAFQLNKLSEGEKAALYYSMSVLMAPENSFVVVDEPETFLNPALANKVWDVLIRERQDCQFIFITHSVNFTLARHGAQIIWIKRFVYPDQFDFEEINDNYMLPKQLMTEILGSKNPVLFCEGDDKTSLDYKVYNALLADSYTVIPVGGHMDVKSNCKVLNEAEWIGTEARGIIDGDLRDPDEIARLQSKGITVLPFYEIEMLLLDHDVIEATVKGAHPREYERIINAFENEFWNYFTKNKDRVAICKIKVIVDGYLESKKIDKCKDVSEIKNNLQTILEIDVDKLHADIISDLDSIIKARDYEKLLNACNLKGEISRGLADKYLDKDYINKAIEHIATDRGLQEKLINNYFKELA